jgi:hypothetical protein
MVSGAANLPPEIMSNYCLLNGTKPQIPVKDDISNSKFANIVND